MKNQIQIQNLKCGGCAKTIFKNLEQITGVTNLSIDIENSTVEFTTENDVLLEKVTMELNKMGYPQISDANDLTHIAKSFISCGMGKFSK